MTDSKNLDTSLSTFYFFLITLFLTIIKQFTGSKTSENVWAFIYLFAILMSQFLLNLTLTASMCGVAQYSLAFYATFIPWMIIFGMLQMILVLMPGWLRPFSNTFGYLAARLYDPETTIKAIFVDPGTESGKQNAETLNHIYNDPSQIINELPTKKDELIARLKIMHESKLIKIPMDADNEHIKKLCNILYLKDNISYMVWYLLAGLTVINISKSFILNGACEKTIDEMESNYEDYLAEKATAKAEAAEAE